MFNVLPARLLLSSRLPTYVRYIPHKKKIFLDQCVAHLTPAMTVIMIRFSAKRKDFFLRERQFFFLEDARKRESEFKGSLERAKKEPIKYDDKGDEKENENSLL